jgi:hypothetical protein
VKFELIESPWNTRRNGVETCPITYEEHGIVRLDYKVKTPKGDSDINMKKDGDFEVVTFKYKAYMVNFPEAYDEVEVKMTYELDFMKDVWPWIKMGIEIVTFILYMTSASIALAEVPAAASAAATPVQGAAGVSQVSGGAYVEIFMPSTWPSNVALAAQKEWIAAVGQLFPQEFAKYVSLGMSDKWLAAWLTHKLTAMGGLTPAQIAALLPYTNPITLAVHAPVNMGNFIISTIGANTSGWGGTIVDVSNVLFGSTTGWQTAVTSSGQNMGSWFFAQMFPAKVVGAAAAGV